MIWLELTLFDKITLIVLQFHTMKLKFPSSIKFVHLIWPPQPRVQLKINIILIAKVNKIRKINFVPKKATSSLLSSCFFPANFLPKTSAFYRVVVWFVFKIASTVFFLGWCTNLTVIFQNKKIKSPWRSRFGLDKLLHTCRRLSVVVVVNIDRECNKSVRHPIKVISGFGDDIILMITGSGFNAKCLFWGLGEFFGGKMKLPFDRH